MVCIWSYNRDWAALNLNDPVVFNIDFACKTLNHGSVGINTAVLFVAYLCVKDLIGINRVCPLHQRRVNGLL